MLYVGILWAPVCGLAMAELITEGRSTTLDLAPFAPARYAKHDVSEGGGKTGRGRKKGHEPVGEQW